MTDDSHRRQPYRSTHMVTTVANLTGARPQMLRAAFRAGLANRDTGVNVAKGVEWSGLGAMLAAGGVLGEKIVTEGVVSHPLLVAAGFAFASIGAITFGVGTFGKMTREQAVYSNELIRKDPLKAMDDVLGQRQIYDEMDATLLGKGIESMTSYIKRNTDDMLNRPSHGLADAIHAALIADKPEPVKAQLAAMAETAEAKTLFADHEMRRSLIHTWDWVDRCVRFAEQEGMMRRGDATANIIDGLAWPAWQNLRLLGLREPSLPAGTEVPSARLRHNAP